MCTKCKPSAWRLPLFCSFPYLCGYSLLYKNNEATAPCHVLWLGWARLNQAPPGVFSFWWQVVRHHHGEGVEDGQVEGRDRGRAIHGLGREMDLKRWVWWVTGCPEWPANHLSSRWCPSLGHCHGPSLGLQSWSSWRGLSWCLWLLSHWGLYRGL